MNIIQLETQFLKFSQNRGFRTLPSFPLVTDDPSVLFINAGITPFKPAMLGGEFLLTTAIVQRCLRTRWNTSELFRFDMLAILGMVPHLHETVGDFFNFLTKEVGLPIANFHCVVNKQDADLLSLISLYLPEQKIHHLNSNNHKYWVRWEFGCGEILTGRGLTLVWEFANRSLCCRTCNIHCECNKFLPLGNIINVLHKPTGCHYFDIGFGVEMLISLFYDGEVYNIDTLQKFIRSFCELGMDVKTSQLLTNLYSAAIPLIKEGMLPSNKKAGYILRKMIRCILELLYTQPFSPIVESIIETTNCYLNLTDDCQDFDRKIISEVIIEECQIYIKNIDRGKQLARNFLAGKENIPVEKLYVEIQSTFGLPRIVIDDLLKGFESDNKFI
jgi:alanyl-tRNA synthetase